MDIDSHEARFTQALIYGRLLTRIRVPKTAPSKFSPKTQSHRIKNCQTRKTKRVRPPHYCTLPFVPLFCLWPAWELGKATCCQASKGQSGKQRTVVRQAKDRCQASKGQSGKPRPFPGQSRANIFTTEASHFQQS